MTVNIRSSALTAQISSHGAELTALRGADGTEYLCPPERRNWDRSAPVLFPNTGAVKNGCTLIGGERYPYIQHGFAKDAEFSVSDQDEGSVSFLLRYSDDTLRLCPYRFELRISYTLTGSTLTVSSGVTNEGPEPMFFSLGFHPGFACPLRPGEHAEDYFFSFGGPINADRVILEDALVSGTVPGFWSGETRIPVREGMFDGGSFTMGKAMKRYPGKYRARRCSERKKRRQGFTCRRIGFTGAFPDTQLCGARNKAGSHPRRKWICRTYPRGTL